MSAESRWRASIAAANRKTVAPSPRCLSFYTDAVVISCGPGSVHWKRFAAGAHSGRTDWYTGQHTTDGEAFGIANASIDAQAGMTMFDQARNTTAAQLAAAHRGNVLIPIENFEGVHVAGVGRYARISVFRNDGDAIELWCRGWGPAFGKQMQVLKTTLGDRLTTEKIRFGPAA